MKKTSSNSAVEFFNDMPDDLLIKLALYDWESLERICLALTLDTQILKEKLVKKSKRDLDI
jgi:hypothetical protein